MQLNSAEDYRFVIPDDDAKDGGAHPFSGDILPRRSAGMKDVLSYEDICFLQEACGELVSAMYYMSGRVKNPFPYGFTGGVENPSSIPVPRALYGAEVGRMRFEGEYMDAGRFAWHSPSKGQYLKQFFDNVGTDMKRLFSSWMPVTPVTGQTLEDLADWKDYRESYSDLAQGYRLYSYGTTLNGVELFDVFYGLILLASSMKSIVAPAETGFGPGKIPLSFGAYDIGRIAYYLAGVWAVPYAMLYDDMAFHQGLSYFTDLGSVPGALGTIYIRPDYEFPADNSVVLTTTSGFILRGSGISTNLEETEPTLESGAVTATASEIYAEDITVMNTDERPSAKLEYAALEKSLGCRLIDLDMDGLPEPSFSVSEVAASERVSTEMLEYAFQLPARCTKLFIPHFNPYYAAYYRGEDFTSYLSGGRYVNYEWYFNGWETVTSNDPVPSNQTRLVSFPGIHFSKRINLQGFKSWSWDSSTETIYLSSERYRSDYGIYEYTDPTDGSVTTMYNEAPGMSKALCPEGAGDWKVLGDVSCTVFVEVDRVVKAWTSVEKIEGTHEVKTFPIRYRLTNPTYSDGRIQWTPSKSAKEMIHEALGLCGVDESTVFDTSVVTSDERPPFASQDGRLPEIPGPPYSSGGYSAAYYEEEITARFRMSVANRFEPEVHMALADVSPRTADQK